MNREYIYVVIHEEHDLQSELQTKNLHAHVVFNPITKDGKAIQTKISDLKKLHDNWRKLLQENGYRIKKYEKDEQLGKLGWKLRKNKDLLEAYKNYLDSKTQQKLIEQQAEQQASQEKQDKLKSILSLVQEEVETVIVEVELKKEQEANKQEYTNKEQEYERKKER